MCEARLCMHDMSAGRRGPQAGCQGRGQRRPCTVIITATHVWLQPHRQHPLHHRLCLARLARAGQRRHERGARHDVGPNACVRVGLAGLGVPWSRPCLTSQARHTPAQPHARRPLEQPACTRARTLAPTPRHNRLPAPARDAMSSNSATARCQSWPAAQALMAAAYAWPARVCVWGGGRGMRVWGGWG